MYPLQKGRETGFSLRIVLGHVHEHADAPHALLRARSDRPCRRCAEQRDELPPFQLIELHSVPRLRAGLQDIGLARVSHERSNPPEARVELARRMPCAVAYDEVIRDYKIVR